MAVIASRRLPAMLLTFAAVVGGSASAQSPLEIQARQFPGKLLAAHNVARAAVGVAPLSWDPALGVEAARYAVELAVSRRFAHSAPAARGATGENLWKGTHGAFTVDEMVAGWTSERRLFTPGIFPAVSRSGSWEQVGHYTQMVWPGTQRVGCALASSAGEDYLVCRYFPAGNVHGRPLGLQPTPAAWRGGR